MLKIKEIHVEGYHKVIEILDEQAGLHGFIAIHNCLLGPAMGGVRIYPYKSKDEAFTDVLRLSKAMTYKSAIAKDGLGGGKSVIIADPARQKTEKLLLSFAEAIDKLGGLYIAAEDVGTNTEDMMVIRKKTPYVAALPLDQSSGDPSRFTAWGVYQGLRAVAKTLWQNTSLRGKTIAIQGLGSVGAKLANILFWEGANLIVTDVNPLKLHKVVTLYNAREVSNQEIYSVDCDIFAPCAMGGIINDQTIPQLKCKAVAGAANNQLLEERHGIELRKRHILYAPDYVINAGGIINAAMEFDPEGYSPTHSRDRVNHIYDTLLHIFEIAEREGKATCQVADELAENNVRNLIGKREKPILFASR